jgi:hypothetical protein
MAWVRNLYPSKAQRCQKRHSFLVGRQRALRDFLFGATGGYKASQDNLCFLMSQINEAEEQRKEHQYIPVDEFIDEGKYRRYAQVNETLTDKEGKVLKGREQAWQDNEAFRRGIQAEAERLYNASPYCVLTRKIKKFQNLHDEAIKKTIEPSHYYIESQPWMYRPDRHVGPEELFSQCREWLNSTSLLPAEIPVPFLIADGSRSLLEAKPLYEFGNEEQVMNMAQLTAAMVESDKRRLNERTEFVSAVDSLMKLF